MNKYNSVDFVNYSSILGEDCVEKLVDECEELSDCSRNAECVNFPGGHTCICNEGFHGGIKNILIHLLINNNSNKLDGHECFDTNECISEELSHSCEAGFDFL